jgi:tetratricopeptide (TPR) repeat protein
MKHVVIFISFFTVCTLPVICQDMLDEVQGEYTEEEAFKLMELVRVKGDEVELCLGIIYHNLALDNPEKYINEALTCLEEAYSTTGSPIALAYYGSAFTILASLNESQDDLVSSLNNLEKGSGMIDDAVKMAPDIIDIRFLRLINAVIVSESSPLDRYEKAMEDILYLKERQQMLGQLSMARLYLYEGLVAVHNHRIEYALTCFEKAIREAPGTLTAMEAENNLFLWEE